MDIQLTRGMVAIVDECDSDLAQGTWHAGGEDRCRYACMQVGRKGAKQRLRMHRVIMERMLGRMLNPGELVDHVDRDTLNNVRSNLRIASNSQNLSNRGRQANNRSGYKGVHKKRGRWAAGICHMGRRVHVGHFDTPHEAYVAYRAKELELKGEFADSWTCDACDGSGVV